MDDSNGWFGGWFLGQIMKLNIRVGYSVDVLYEFMLVSSLMMTLVLSVLGVRLLGHGDSWTMVSGAVSCSLLFISLNKYGSIKK